MRYETAEVSADDAMPCCTLLRIKLEVNQHDEFVLGHIDCSYFSFDMLRNVLQKRQPSSFHALPVLGSRTFSIVYFSMASCAIA